eukprot:7689764-Pyramimonas_sp.AAC.1
MVLNSTQSSSQHSSVEVVPYNIPAELWEAQRASVGFQSFPSLSLPPYIQQSAVYQIDPEGCCL